MRTNKTPDKLRFHPQTQHVNQYLKNFDTTQNIAIEHLGTKNIPLNINMSYAEAVSNTKHVQAQIILDKIQTQLASGCTCIEITSISHYITENPENTPTILALLGNHHLDLKYYSGINDTPMGEELWSKIVIIPAQHP